jgi:hypothetical protein
MRRYNAQGQLDDEGDFVRFDEAIVAINEWQEKLYNLQMIYGIKLSELHADVDRHKTEANKYRTLKETLTDIIN